MQTDVKWIGLLVVVVGGPAREELATRASHHDAVDGGGLTDGRALERGRCLVASPAHGAGATARTGAATRTTPVRRRGRAPRRRPAGRPCPWCRCSRPGRSGRAVDRLGGLVFLRLLFF